MSLLKKMKKMKNAPCRPSLSAVNGVVIKIDATTFSMRILTGSAKHLLTILLALQAVAY